MRYINSRFTYLLTYFAFPAEAGPHFTDAGGMKGRLDLVGWLHSEMVYPPEDGHPSKY